MLIFKLDYLNSLPELLCGTSIVQLQSRFPVIKFCLLFPIVKVREKDTRKVYALKLLSKLEMVSGAESFFVELRLIEVVVEIHLILL